MRSSSSLAIATVICLLGVSANSLYAQTSKIENSKLRIEVNQNSGAYTIASKGNPKVWITATPAAEINHRWLHPSDYPKHGLNTSAFSDDSGSGTELTVTYSGSSSQPDLIWNLRMPEAADFVDIETRVHNSTQSQITVQGIRVVEGKDAFLSLDGPQSADRVLSDSFSEDRPDMKLHDLGDATSGMHRAVGSQLIYNRQSRQSLFLGTLTSDKWLTVLRLRVDGKQNITGYEVDSTGTTELENENSLRESPPEDHIELSLPLEPGQTLSSERLMASLSSDYHSQLETYGKTIRQLHHARVTAPTPIGWWSWTAYYFGLTEGAALTNAEFLSEHLLDLGYKFFHIDEGYQFARGDYTSIVSYKFPHGMKQLEQKVRDLGLTPGIWTAPFEVADRSSVYLNHKNWLVHNAQGQPIHAGWVLTREDAGKDLDPLYVLDTTNPGAQQYLLETYSTLTRDWGIRYIKMDFMDDTAIEGYYYRPHTTAMEAQRIGLQVIRDAVGENVLLDKDGSVMLNPVGLVDAGRISCDTGHTFDASRDAAPGIAARYYMNRNFFVADPDAFSVSHQAYAEQQDHGGARALTLDEAQVAVALAAVSGGMFEIGDDLPTLFLNADRMKLLQNRDLLNMVRYGHAAKPLDLMSYAPEDEMPSIFLLRESKRQSILAVFNWTEKERQHSFPIADLLSDPALGSHNTVSDVFSDEKPISENQHLLSLKLPPHSVRMLKIMDSSIPASAPSLTVDAVEKIETGKSMTFSAQSSDGSVPAVSYHWDFGDGTSADGIRVAHCYTHAGNFTVRLTADGIEGIPFEKSIQVSATGIIDTVFRPELYERYTAPH
ncbi:MAG TPA: PKD domain-containing protein [Candidatus Aquilonibacter sp.]|nr:PKD domain-containing protein [Candidatus Aquilonibacter sp.]